MKQGLIKALETICPDEVYLQGTVNKDEGYPDEFITIWTNYIDDNAHYNNDVTSFVASYSVIFYSNNPERVASVPATIRSVLKKLGFIPQGKGNDIASDEPTHTGWAMDFLYREN